MPPRNAAPPATPPSTALVIPDDIRQDLLRTQADSIGTPQRLSRVKIMPAAAGLYEFADTNDTTREFTGVILGSHARNVLWDGAMGAERPRDGNNEEVKGPACSSHDGKVGRPRAGFAHAALQVAGREEEVEATGDEQIECATCPYNQFNSKRLVDEATRSPKAKAVTNQRSIYILVEGRAVPVELVISNTSIPVFDEYLSSLLQREIPVQAVVTKFTQTVKSKPGTTIRYAIAAFDNVGPLNPETFNEVLAKRSQYINYIRPQDIVAADATFEDVGETLHEAGPGDTPPDAADPINDLPF